MATFTYTREMLCPHCGSENLRVDGLVTESVACGLTSDGQVDWDTKVVHESHIPHGLSVWCYDCSTDLNDSYYMDHEEYVRPIEFKE